jgi:hypothetical protein
MNSRGEQGALRGAVDLVRTPYVVNVLNSLHHGRQPAPAAPAPGEREAFAVAIQLLADAGVLDAPAGGGSCPSGAGEWELSLTEMGRDVAAIVAELCRKP